MGDLKNSVERLRKLLKATRYPPSQTNANFTVADLLRILHHALLDYSRHVAAFILDKGYDLYAKTDARFVDRCFRLMREEFDYFPSLNATQFLSNQFFERKIQLVAEILDAVVKKHDACMRQRRQKQAVWTQPRELKSHSTHVQNHVMPPPLPPSTPTIDTWSLLEHLRKEAKLKARQQKQSALANSQPKQRSQPHTRGLLPPRTPSPDNQVVRSGSTSSQSEAGSSFEYSHAAHVASHEGCACGCSETKAEVQEVLTTLSKQISDLTSAVLSRVSSIEARLGRVEQQLEEMNVAKNQLETQPTKQQRSHSHPQPLDARSELSAASEGLRRFQSSWPPDPEMVSSQGYY